MSSKKKRDRAFGAPPTTASLIQRNSPALKSGKHAPATGPSSDKADQAARWNREAIESVVVAIILAFLFRAFEAEAFVIPTGSMAPTLRGRYLSVQCEKCHHWHQVGASVEEIQGSGFITQTLCPMCQYPTPTISDIGIHGEPTYPGLNGDRILVNKFAYDFFEPKRWDVIVFKFPANAKQNFIKRLVGLPGETLKLSHGDVFTTPDSSTPFQIQRKPPIKVQTLLQPVHDTQFIPDQLTQAGWPARWQPMGKSADQVWKVQDGGRTMQFTAEQTTDTGWLRYQHFIPGPDYWELIEANKPLPTEEPLRPRPSLITDFYAYNAKMHQAQARSQNPELLESTGGHWVGDLAVTCDLQVDSSQGTFRLELVESTRKYQCEIDIATGATRVLIEGEGTGFHGNSATDAKARLAQGPLRGAGKHTVRFANVDDQLFVWINGRLLEFDGPTTFDSPERQRPQWSPTDPGDLAPIGIATQGMNGSVQRLQVHRDVYYVAVKQSRGGILEYDPGAKEENLGRLQQFIMSQQATSHDWYVLEDYFRFPEVWQPGDLFDRRRSEIFELKQDQFFPMGDNSPSSKDARLWEGDSYVERNLLLGKAFLIYYPQGQIPGFPGRVALDGVPILNVLPPDLTRMGPIR